jgi:hypothetical protein
MARRSVVAGMAGLAAVILYMGAVVLGGILDPTYSHVSDSVSELTSPRAPNRAVLGTVFTAYNLALAVMAVALLRTSRGTGRPRLGSSSCW